MITAWQISSTLDKMQEFIRFVQQFDKQRSQLQKLLPLISRIKRVSQERDLMNKQLYQLNKTILPIDIFVTQTKHTQQSKQHTTQPQQSSQIGQKYNFMLTKLSKQLSTKQKQNYKYVQKLKKQLLQKNKKEEEQQAIKREQLLMELQQFVCQKLKNVQLKKVQQSQTYGLVRQNQMQSPLLSSMTTTKTKKHTIFDNFINNYINLTFSKQFLQQGDNQYQIVKVDNNDKKFHIKQLIISKHEQLSELKCRLLSLEDKRRKLVVNKLFNGNMMQGNNKVGGKINNNNGNSNKSITITTPKHIQQSQKGLLNIIDRNNKKRQQQKKKQSKSLLGSIMSIFSSSSDNIISSNEDKNIFDLVNNNNSNNNNDKKTKGQKQSQQNQTIYQHQYQHQKQQQIINNNKDNTSNLNNTQQLYQNIPSLLEIDDNEVRLRVAQILAQIIQFKQHLDIMFGENVINKCVNIVGNINRVKNQLRCFIEQLVRVCVYVKEQLLQTKLSKNKDGMKNYEGNNDKEKFIISLLKQNKQIQFFLQFINEHLKKKHKLIQSLFIILSQNIPTIKKFIYKKTQKLQKTYKQFQYRNKQKYNIKLKSTQSRRQFDILSKKLLQINNFVNINVMNKLIRLQNVLSLELVRYMEQIRCIIMKRMKQLQQQQQYQQINKNVKQISKYSQQLITLTRINKQISNLLITITISNNNNHQQQQPICTNNNIQQPSTQQQSPTQLQIDPTQLQQLFTTIQQHDLISLQSQLIIQSLLQGIVNNDEQVISSFYQSTIYDDVVQEVLKIVGNRL